MKKADIVCLVMLFIIGGAILHKYIGVLANFRAAYPCPSTGELQGMCPCWSANLVFAGVHGNIEWQSLQQNQIQD